MEPARRRRINVHGLLGELHGEITVDNATDDFH